MGRQARPKRWWGVTYVNSHTQVMPDTIRETRREAQKACCDNRYRYRDDPDGWRAEWKDWHKRGCRAVRVTVLVAGNGGET